MFKFKVGAEKMVREIRARFSGGTIEPLERLDFEEGEVLKVIISPIAKGKTLLEALKTTAGGWKGLVDGEELKKNIYTDRLISNRPTPSL